jgi:hypothetical protein
MISREKLKRLRQLAEHKLAVANTSVTGAIRFANIEPRDLLALVEAAESYREHLREVGSSRRRQTNAAVRSASSTSM